MAKTKTTTKKAPAGKTSAKAAKAKEGPKSKPPKSQAAASEPEAAPTPRPAPAKSAPAAGASQTGASQAGASQAGASQPGASQAGASQPGNARRADPGLTPRAHAEAQLSKSQVGELYQKLLDERAKVIRGLDKHLGEAVTDIDPLADEVDVATRHSEQAYLIRFADKERKLLREIDHALEKMRSGEYGLCEGTDEAIGYPRLALRPWTRYSVRYKEELEREKRQRQF